MKLTVVLPWPVPALWPNRRANWRALAAARKEARRMGYFSGLAAGEWHAPEQKTIPLVVVFCPPTRRRFDNDGALSAMKGALDGIAAAMGVDDQYFEPVTIRRGEVSKPGKVILTFGTNNDQHYIA